MQLINVKVSSAKKVKEGEGEYGPWELWNLTINGDKYSWFRKEKDPAPEKGMVIAFAEYEEVQKGEYTNRNISGKSLKWGEKAPDKPQAATKGGYTDFPPSMLFSYIKDMVIAHPAFQETAIESSLQTVIALFKDAQKALSSEPEKSAFVVWLEENKALIDEESWAKMCVTYDVETLANVTNRNHQKEIFKFVEDAKKAKEKDDAPF